MPKQLAIKLPNAPLVEAVFELRWAVQAGLAYADPGFPMLREAFTRQVKRMGFAVHRDIGPPDALVAPYSVGRRFFIEQEKEFPLLQIGPGIFASNQSAEYDWPNFKKQVSYGVRLLLSSYPVSTDYPLKPIYLELRYVDVFDASLVNTTNLVRFLNDATTLKMQLPSFFNKTESINLKGRLILQTQLKQRKASQFAFDVGSGARNITEDIVRLETKVFTGVEGVPKLGKTSRFLRDVNRWLEFAHQYTRPFFKDFVTTKVMDKFRKAH